jgi:hypothetical protein
MNNNPLLGQVLGGLFGQAWAARNRRASVAACGGGLGGAWAASAGQRAGRRHARAGRRRGAGGSRPMQPDRC